ncbi:FG-GAP-like repeat-containing protein [Thalassobius sp. S69A]|uniref:FG-GAP-like repeat-containing protein n=1 Tax=unclassified Thalassovita TaxID=2619711 RepID=UPI000C0D5508|nr:RNA-binding protein [Paracoccaceae bacterium]MBT24858.1 RNA-binding protein [Paracoccaceae bacterium]
MVEFIRKPYEKRFFLALLIVAILAYLFWTGSRYPALNEKAMMSGAIQLEDVLSFEARFPITPEMGIFERIFWSTLNWINTNKKGMTFGVLFAAAFLTAVSYLRIKSFRGGLANSFLGLAIGTPLGVCVNCAAPIARGMYSSGLRAETTLSAMIASPTLNVVVLTMLFSLMPFYMAVTKVAFSLLIILALVPVICRLLPQTQLPADQQISAPTPWSAAELGAPSAETLPQALIGVAVTYAKNLWYIIVKTVPLMLLAGILGTIVAVALPGEVIMDLPFSFLVLAVLVVIGVFLPVPIGFDVVMAGVLLASGLEHGYVMALLFTLGSFSVYSFMIVVQALGARAGWMLAASVAICGAITGSGVHQYHQWQSDRALRMLQGAVSAPWMAAQAATAEPDLMPQVVSPDADRITIQAVPFNAPSAPDALPFTRVEARSHGIDKPLEFSFRDMWPPYWEGRSLAAADFDRDGDLDIAIASTEQTLYLYENDGTGQFTRLTPDLGPLTGLELFNAAFADIDNDGWPDLFLTSYGQGNYLWRNVEGRFGHQPAQPVVNNPDTPLTLALSIADPDRDGDLDVALGNWAAGWYRRIPGEESRNRILWNQAGTLTGDDFTALPGIPGETLTMLFSDINDDGAADLIVGNDFAVPDYFYHGDGQGGFHQITRSDALIPHTTTTTMAIAVGDLTNDGRQEIYLAQIAGRSSGVSEKLKMQPLAHYCDVIQNPQDRALCQKNMQIKAWYRSGNNFDPTYASNCQKLTGRYQAECKAMLVKDLAIQRRDASICALIPASQPVPRAYCDIHFKAPRPVTAQEADQAIEQVLRSNVLLQWDGARYLDQAGALGLEIGGWSWDTKLGDFDNDGDLDVYVVNGTWVPNEVSPSNLFFENDGNGHFREASGPYGLEDYLMTAAALQFDMDNDGDLDVLTHTVNGPIVLFRNNNQAQAISVSLHDTVGNRDGIGAQIALTMDDGRKALREVQLGGGFMSFDAPVAHFGLGTAMTAKALTVRWPDGSETAIKGPIRSGASYRIIRSR